MQSLEAGTRSLLRIQAEVIGLRPSPGDFHGLRGGYTSNGSDNF